MGTKVHFHYQFMFNTIHCFDLLSFALKQKESNKELSEAISCTPLKISNMCIKDQGFIAFKCISTSGFLLRHASRSL